MTDHIYLPLDGRLLTPRWEGIIDPLSPIAMPLYVSIFLCILLGMSYTFLFAASSKGKSNTNKSWIVDYAVFGVILLILGVIAVIMITAQLKRATDDVESCNKEK